MEHDDLIEIAEHCLKKVLRRMKSKALRGAALEKMKLIEGAASALEVARLK